MLLARKIIDDFIDKIDGAEKEEMYSLATENNMELAMAKLAIKYEEIYKDYPSGFVADLLLQHLKDKAFQNSVKKSKEQRIA